MNECNWLSSALADDVSNNVMSDWLSFMLPDSDRFCTDALCSTSLKIRIKLKLEEVRITAVNYETDYYLYISYHMYVVLRH